MTYRRYANLAKYLSSKLKEKKLTQGDVAEWCDVSQAAVNGWLHGDKRPHATHAAILLMHLELDLNELAVAGKYDPEDILRFRPQSMNGSPHFDYAEQLLQQIRQAISLGHTEGAIQRVGHLSAWLARTALPFQRPLDNLPPSKDNLVNQRDAQERVLKALDSRWPIVVIEGPPGSSKSTLAVQVGREGLLRHRRALYTPFEAVVWVTAKDHPEQKRWLDKVVDDISLVLGYTAIRNLPQKDKRIQGLTLLCRYRVLLILDNYETMQDPELEAWIHQVPEPSKVLITCLPNRVRSASLVALHGLSRAESIALLARRAPHLYLYGPVNDTGTPVPSLVEISAGNPKVMEVALGMAKYEQRSLNEIVTQLQSTPQDKQLEKLLTHVWKDLGGTIGGERMVMDGAELQPCQQVLIVMPFFVEGVSKEALAAAANIAGEQLDHALTQLVDLGVIDVHPVAQSPVARFSIHPVVRAFVSSKLAAIPMFEKQARAAWSDYFLRYVEQYGDDDRGECVGYGRAGHREKLTAELLNICATIEWCFRHDEEKAVRLVESITTYLLDEGRWSDRLELVLLAYAVAKTRKMPRSEVGLLVRKGWSELVKGKWDTAQRTYQQAIMLARAYNVIERLVQALRDLGHLFAACGQSAQENRQDEAEALFAQADQLIAESFVLAQESNDEIGILEARAFAARVAYLRGDIVHLQVAKGTFHALLTECYAARQWRHLLFIYRYLAHIALREGDIKAAQQHLDLSNETLQNHYYEAHEEAQNMELQGDIEVAQADYDQARTTYHQALALAIRLGMEKEKLQIDRKLFILKNSHERLVLRA